MSAMRKAAALTHGHAAETAVPVLCELAVGLALLIAGGFLQRCMTDAGLLKASDFAGGLSLWDLWLPGCLLAGITAQTPLAVTRSRMLAELAGVLGADDLGFLRCCTEWWLWGSMLRVRLLGALLLGLSCVPPFLLLTAAGTVLRLSVGTGEAVLPLMTAVHLLLAGLGMMLLPLRVIAAQGALPYCWLKNPHHTARAVLRHAFAVSRAHAVRSGVRRLVLLPLMLLPPAAISVMPRLRTAELLEARRQDTVTVHKIRPDMHKAHGKTAQSSRRALAHS